jgi:hypothetical protein
MLTYSFPFCAVSNFNDHDVDAEITVTCKKPNISTTKKVSLKTQTWNNQTPTDLVSIDIDRNDLCFRNIEFEISVNSNKPTPVLFFRPTLIDEEKTVHSLATIQQTVIDTDFDKSNTWYNMPLLDSQRADCIIEIPNRCRKDKETINDVVDFLRDKVSYENILTYKTKEQNRPHLTVEENIEYYLGKDRYKNLFFAPTLPATWDIPARPLVKGSTANNVDYDTDQQIEYRFNNLGYRSNFDYDLQELKEKRLVLCLGDSDVFGAYNDIDSIWTSRLQQKLPDTTVLNFGIRGTSGDGMTRIGVRAIEALKSSIVAVCVHWPPPALREVVSKTFKCGVHTHRNYHLPYTDWWKHIDWQSNNYNYYKNQILLSSVCNKYNIPYYELISNKDDATVPYDVCRYGVYDSFGPATHTATANYFYKKIINQPSLFQSLQS